ncbi:hypothetical protein [Anaerobiospirillum succiniciproducens]|uniref:hypothetical protein n=1 Tax=Anaerobiospirillum succiniciproducens TaxID=13335 RepID=UPI00248D723E|nr:hypothetical protein [Anaerobiospirillum succiniciproducens]MDO4675006.1 hypothetical protein [Anaerobiospirillum succiniciproducens]
MADPVILGSSFKTPQMVDGVLKTIDKDGKEIWISNKSAGLGGGVNPINVRESLPDPTTCKYGTYFVIGDD